MKEQLFTIPVNDAFRRDCECPVCSLHQELEQNSIEYTMGPSYMEDDNRAMTDKLGFCQHHIQMLYHQKNRLGLALMLKTHTDKTIRELKERAKTTPSANGIFRRNTDTSPVSAYIRELESHCFICERMEDTFSRYIDTIFYLWKKDADFRSSFAACKGFCTWHYGILYDTGASKLNKTSYAEFISCLNQVYFAGMERVNADIEWFINKYDYRYANEPWKNSKDAIPRGILKTNHIEMEE